MPIILFCLFILPLYSQTITTTGLIGKYTYTAGSGTVIADSSGIGNDATLVGAASWIGAGGISVNLTSALGQGVNFPSTIDNTVKTIMVCASTGGGTGQTNALFSNFLIGSATNTGWGFSVWQPGVPGIISRPTIMGPGNTTKIVSGNYYATAVHCFTIVLGTTDVIYVDGIAPFDYAVGPGTSHAFFGVGGGVQLGRSSYAAATGFDFRGNIYFTAFWTAELTAQNVSDDAASVLAYLSGRGNSLTVANTSTGKLLHGVGDSICNLACTPNGGFIDTFQYEVNDGVAGTACSQWVTKAPPWTTALFYPLASRNIVVLYCGTNDLASATPAATFANYSTIAIALVSHGFQVYLATALSRSGTGQGGNTWDSLVQSYNALIRAGWRSLGVTGLIDYASNSNLGCTGCSSNTTFFSDGIHPTPTGTTLMDTYTRAAINAGSSGGGGMSSGLSVGGSVALR